MPPVTLRATINGHDICYSIRGRSEQGILFLHGLGCSKESFEHAFEGGMFPEEVTLIVPDLLGHGESSKPTDFSYSIEDHGDLVARLVQSLAIRRVHIVGHSMGGAIGLLCLERLPSIASFFCLEGNLIFEDCTVARKIASVGEREFVERLFPFAPLRFRCRGLPSDRPIDPVAFYRSAQSLLARSQSGVLLRTLLQLNSRKAYIYGGDNEHMVVLSRLEGVELVRIDDCGHFMMLDRPAETYQAIRERLLATR